MFDVRVETPTQGGRELELGCGAERLADCEPECVGKISSTRILLGPNFKGIAEAVDKTDLGRGGSEGQIRQDLRRSHGAQCRNL